MPIAMDIGFIISHEKDPVINQASRTVCVCVAHLGIR